MGYKISEKWGKLRRKLTQRGGIERGCAVLVVLVAGVERLEVELVVDQVTQGVFETAG